MQKSIACNHFREQDQLPPPSESFVVQLTFSSGPLLAAHSTTNPWKVYVTETRFEDSVPQCDEKKFMVTYARDDRHLMFED